MNQAFTTKEMIRQRRRHDLKNWGVSKEELNDQLDNIVAAIEKGTFEFGVSKTNDYYSVDSLTNSLVLRKLNDNIKRVYKDKQSNRNLIIEQLITLLTEKTPFYILRTDVTKFYESINRNELLYKIRDDGMLSYQCIYLLNKLFESPPIKNFNGLPRGLNISATLSEIKMRNIDKWIVRGTYVYYYARFVDDIIVFISKQNFVKTFRKDLENRLSDIGLSVNTLKTKEFSYDSIEENSSLQYLGYKFWFEGKDKNRKLVVSIADRKVNKTKSRIVWAMLDFIKNKDFDLLKLRIKFLTGNFIIREGIDCSHLKAGIFYSYHHLNNFSILQELDTFLHSIVNSKKSSFGKKLSSVINISQKNEILKYSFYFGFQNKVTHCFSYNELAKIEKCWS